MLRNLLCIFTHCKFTFYNLTFQNNDSIKKSVKM